MPGDTGFMLILLAALLAVVGVAVLQTKSYQRAVSRLQRQYAGRSGLFLVSGRGKGLLRGAIVVAVVTASGEIIDAEAMVGSTAFARFRRRPDLHGTIGAVIERTEQKWLRKALEQAQEQFQVAHAADQRRTQRRSKRSG